MTLISTTICQYGMVLASHSNLCNNEENSGLRQKVFPVPYLSASSSYIGLYRIGGHRVLGSFLY